jgi:hypothetical protein
LYRVPILSRHKTLSDFVKSAKEFSKCNGIENVQVTSSLEEAETQQLARLVSEELPTSCLLIPLLGWQLSEGVKDVADCIVSCDMCSRKIGLWGYINKGDSSRVLDVTKEHKAFCPYVNGEAQSVTGSRSEGTCGWQQKFQSLTSGQDNTSRSLPLNQKQVRKMKSSEALAKVKSLMM